MKNPLQHLNARVRSSTEDTHDSDLLEAPDDRALEPPDDQVVSQPADPADAETDEPGDDRVEVRRNGSLAAVIGSVAAVVALAYLVRAIGSGAVVDWLVFVVIGAVATVHGLAFRDARTPLLVADGTGVRLRLGRTWQGLPWDELEEIEHAPRHTLLRDGRLVAFPVDPDAVLAGLDPRARRQAAISERIHGAPFAVPLGLTTRVVGGGDAGLTAALLALAPDPELVVEVVPDDTSWAAQDETDSVSAPRSEELFDGEADDTGDTRDTGAIESVDDLTDTAERVRPDVSAPVDLGHSSPREGGIREVRPAPAVRATSTPSPLRQSVAAVRTEVTRRITGHQHEEQGEQRRDLVASSAPQAAIALPAPPQSDRLQREASDYFAAGPDDTGVWRSTTEVISEVAGPSLTPVIGPQLARARQALGLDVEKLAERTRIRAHVIDAIEIDDFEPCGGDFYARGHLRTLARVLGVDVTPLLATYDETYADAPIDPRRVFEAELATGSEGAIRSLRSGANWSVVVAAVMALVLAWSVARLVIDRPDAASDAPSLSGDSAGLTSGETVLAPAVPVVLSAEGGGAKVVVRDGAGTVVFKGNLAFGQSKTVKASPPVRVQTSDGSLSVGIAGQKAERMGRTGASARNTFVPRVD